VFAEEGGFGVAEGHILTLHSFRLAVHEVNLERSEGLIKINTKIEEKSKK